MKHLFFGISMLVVIGFLALFFNPAPMPDADEQLLSYKGKVIELFVGGTADVVLKFENHQTTYFINRGLENGLILQQLEKDILNKSVEVKYPNYWTPLDPTKSWIHVTILKKDDQILYTEIDC